MKWKHSSQVDQHIADIRDSIRGTSVNRTYRESHICPVWFVDRYDNWGGTSDR